MCCDELGIAVAVRATENHARERTNNTRIDCSDLARERIKWATCFFYTKIEKYRYLEKNRNTTRRSYVPRTERVCANKSAGNSGGLAQTPDHSWKKAIWSVGGVTVRCFRALCNHIAGISFGGRALIHAAERIVEHVVIIDSFAPPYIHTQRTYQNTACNPTEVISRF